MKLHDDKEELRSLSTEISRRHDDRYYDRWEYVDEELNDKRRELLHSFNYTFAKYLRNLITDWITDWEEVWKVDEGPLFSDAWEEDANLNINLEQHQAAEQNMMQWLTDRNEQGKAPSEIEYTEQFNYHEMFYYLFKFKTDPSENWMLGVSGGFKAGSLKPCGHTFSDMRPYCEETQVKDAIQMVDHVVECWKERNRRFDRR